MPVSPHQLKAFDLLSELNDTELSRLCSQLHVTELKRNQVLFQKGQDSSELYFLLKGRLKAVDYSSNGREIGFTFFDAGSHFGELSLIDHKQRSATVVATESSHIAYLPKNEARKLIFETPSVSEKLLLQLTRIIRENNDHIVLLGSANASARINTMLLKYARKDANGLRIEKLPTQTEIATMTNTTRETVSRTLSHLIELGYIEKNGKSLIIHEPQVLEEMLLEE